MRIQGSATYLPEDYADSIRLLQTARQDGRHRHRIPPLEQVAEAFDLSLSGDHIKVLVTLGDASH